MKQYFSHQEKNNLNIWLTIAVCALVTITAVFSLINPQMVYSTTELNHAYYPSDIGIVLFGLPVMILTLLLVWKGKFIGLLLWPGALFFLIYSYALYFFGIPFGYWTVMYFLIVVLSGIIIARVLQSINYKECRSRYVEKIPTRFASIVLIFLGSIILLRTVVLVSSAVRIAQSMSQLDIALWITDLCIAAPALLIVGIQLWRKKNFAIFAAPGLLMQYIILSLGLLPVFYYQANGDLSKIDTGGLIVIVFMILFCLIPFIQLVKSIKRE
jgi:hypothetical protein